MDSEALFKNFTREFGLYSVAAAVPSFLGLAAVMVFTRVFSTGEYGLYALAIVAVTVLDTVSFGWIKQSILRFDSVDDRVTDGAVTIVGILAVLVAIVGIGIFASFRQYLAPYREFYLASLALLIVNGSYRTLSSIFRARIDPKKVTLYNSTRAVAKFLAAVLIAVVLLDDIVGWIWGGVIGTGLAILLMIGSLYGTVTLSFDLGAWRRIAAYGLPMVGWLFGFTLFTFADRWILEFLQGTAAVGIYSSNYSLSRTGLSLVFGAIIGTAHPRIMKSWSEDGTPETRELMTEFSRYFVLIGLPAIVFASVISIPLVTVALGPDFREGYLVIPIVGAALFLWNFAMLGHKGLELTDRTEIMTVGVLFTVIVNVILNVVLIPIIGYLGAAVATLLSSLLYTGFAFGTSVRTVRWDIPWRSVGRSTLAATLMLGTGLLGYLGASRVLVPLVMGGIGWGVYLLALYCLGELRADELEVLGAVLR